MSSLDLVTRANAAYVDEQYRRYLADPASVDERWALFFAGFEMANGNGAGTAPVAAAPAAEPVIGVFDLVHSYRELGHAVAKLNPLGHHRPDHPLLQLTQFNITEADLDRSVGGGSFQGHTDGTLRDLIANPTEYVSKEQATFSLAQGIGRTNPAEARKLLEPLRTSPGAVSQAAIQLYAELSAK